MTEKTKNFIRAYVYHPFSISKALLLSLAGFIAGVFIPPLIIFITITLYLPQLPDIEKLEDYKPPLISEVYSSDGVKLGQFAGRRRIWVSLSEVSPYLVNALLAIEDNDFYDHWGVSVNGIIRSFFKNIKAGRIVQGGSTITMQLSKNLFLSSKKAYIRKLKEALTSILIERQYSKSEILELYLNQNFLGKGCYGVEAASQFYFECPAESLKIEEAAFIVGLLQRPSYYMRNLDGARQRRNSVLAGMERDALISPQQLDSLSKLPLVVNTNNYGRYKAPYFVEDVRRYLEAEYGEDALYNGGLTIYTTLDYEVQKLVDTALERKLSSLQNWNEKIKHHDDTLYAYRGIDPEAGDSTWLWKQVQGAVVVIEPSTGYIKAMAGGRDFYTSQFNRATQARRQPGSAFKPFVYTAAMDNGWQPADKVSDTPETFPMEEGKEWRPKNYDGTYLGDITLRTALMKSKNLATIHVAEKVGPQRIAEYATRLGIDAQLEPYLSIAMGTSVVTPLDITTAYCAFANGGIKVEPIMIMRIEDSEGRILEQNFPEREEVLSQGVAYVMQNLMESVLDHGTGYGARLSGFDRPAGGKTGTTNDCTDAWFIGYTPQFCTGVWVGYDEIVSLGESQTGSRAALPVWTEIMLHCHEGYKRREFVPPFDEVSFKNICTESGQLATSRCPETVKEVFLLKNPLPEEMCELSHREGEREHRIIDNRKDQDFQKGGGKKDNRKGGL